MSARPEIMKQLWIVGIVGTLFLLAVFLYGLRKDENYDVVNKAWSVKKILIEGKDAKNGFKKLRFNLLDDGSVILPESINFKRKGWPIKYSNYKYKRDGLIEGQIIIDDWLQNIFTGTYDIEIIRQSNPFSIKLHSENVVFILEEQRFTIENPTIKMEPYMVDTIKSE